MIILELISDKKYSKEDHPAANNPFITNNFTLLTDISRVHTFASSVYAKQGQ